MGANPLVSRSIFKLNLNVVLLMTQIVAIINGIKIKSCLSVICSPLKIANTDKLAHGKNILSGVTMRWQGYRLGRSEDQQADLILKVWINNPTRGVTHITRNNNL